jgi:hypothetical protein
MIRSKTTLFDIFVEDYMRDKNIPRGEVYSNFGDFVKYVVGDITNLYD